VYTSTLDRSKFTKEQLERAERQAREIESEVSQDIVVRMDRNQACDRDLSEEELYGSVMKNTTGATTPHEQDIRYNNSNARDSPSNSNPSRRQSNNSPMGSNSGNFTHSGGGGWPRGTHVDNKNRTAGPAYPNRMGHVPYGNNSPNVPYNVRSNPVTYANKVKASNSNNNVREDHSVRTSTMITVLYFHGRNLLFPWDYLSLSDFN